MRISFTDEVEGGRVLYPIGRVSAASAWHGPAAMDTASSQADALRALIEAAKECDADAIIGVGYAEDGVQNTDLSAVELRRVSATGIAVKLARAA